MSAHSSGPEEAGPPPENEARLKVVKSPMAGPVLCRVVSMMLTRAAWPVDQLHEVMLVCDALSAHAPAHASDGTVTFSLAAQRERVELRVEELKPDGAAGIVRDAELPGVGNVLERIPASLAVQPTDTGSELVLVLVPA